MNFDSAPELSRTIWTASQIDAAVSRALANADSADPLRGALEAALAHYCQLLTDALNRAPELHLAAFAGLLPIRAVPPVPASAPLSFKAARTSTMLDAPVVPRLTEVAAPSANGSGAPVVFQTTHDLPVLRVEPRRALRVDSRRRLLTDVSALVASGAAAAVSAPLPAMPLAHAVHLGLQALGAPPALTSAQVNVDVANGLAAPRDAMLEWGIATPQGFVPWAPLSDTTQGLTQSGQIAFGALPMSSWPQTSVHGIQNCWLSARFRETAEVATAQAQQTAADADADAANANANPASPSALIRTLSITTHHTLATVPVEAASYGRIPLDVTRDFFPFGERPHFGDVFYVASKYFAMAGAEVELQLTLTNPADGDPDAAPIALVSAEGEPRVQWEMQVPSGWTPLSVMDETRSLTVNGTLRFTVPADAAATPLGALVSGWLRARLMSGTYSVVRPTMDSVMTPPMVAPSIVRISTSVSITRGPLQPEQLVLDDGLEQIPVGTTAQGQHLPFRPFPAAGPTGEILYLGVQGAPADLANRTLNTYVVIAMGDAPPVCRDTATTVGTAPRWQVRVGSGWQDCQTVDQTAGFRESGFIAVTIGPEVAAWSDAVAEPDRKLLWLRCLLDSQDDGPRLPTLQHIAVNVVPAIQSIRLEHEVLGSSTGRPGMVFHTARAPLVGEVELDVREGVAASARPWQRWQCVESLDDAAPQSTVFVIDRLTGAITFGDGRHGMIPPAGGNNLRASYAAGGGAQGNCAPLKIAQLRTTIPHIESVTNVDAACGGQDAQGEHASRQAALAWLRHRDRAVCLDDYAALALRASPEVARASALGASELTAGGPLSPGAVGVVIVPYSIAREPQPSAALLRSVKRFLDARRPAGVDLTLSGPGYLRVNVSATLAIDPDTVASRVIAQCVERIDRFLHPLTGGRAGCGWAFGSQPHASDLHEVLAGVEGLDYAQSIRLRFDSAFPHAPGAACHLICAGTHALRTG